LLWQIKLDWLLKVPSIPMNKIRKETIPQLSGQGEEDLIML